MNYNAIGVLLLMAVAGTFFLLVGIWFLRTPTRKLLDWDRRTGYWLYRGELERSGDEKQAVAAAGCFYKFFGYCFVVFCSLYLLIVVAAFIATVTGLIKFNNP